MEVVPDDTRPGCYYPRWALDPMWDISGGHMTSAQREEEEQMEVVPITRYLLNPPVEYGCAPRPVDFTDPPEPVEYGCAPRPADFTDPPEPIEYGCQSRPDGFTDAPEPMRAPRQYTRYIYNASIHNRRLDVCTTLEWMECRFSGCVVGEKHRHI